MGRAEFGTPKWVANKMKAKGLQKLRWYCQMCQKQCRDENGFKCHTSSESHQRQLLIFADNSRKYLSEFSHEFAKGYLEILRRQYGSRRVHANKVYQDYISDRHHLHMNATQWCTLTGFVKWLGRTGKCIVDETEKGWYITYIDRDPETIKAQEARERKEKMDKDDQEKMLAFLKKQIKRGKESAKKKEGEEDEESEPADFVRESEDQLITLDLKLKKPEASKPELNVAEVFKVPEVKKEKKDVKKEPEKRKLTALEEIIEEEKEHKKKKFAKSEYWLVENIVVKVKTKSLGEKYNGKKGVILRVFDKFCAEVSMIDTGHKLKLDQCHLETVIPAIGRDVKILNGPYRGMIATMKEVNTEKFCVSAKIATHPFKGKTVDDIPYEDVSKVNVS